MYVTYLPIPVLWQLLLYIISTVHILKNNKHFYSNRPKFNFFFKYSTIKNSVFI